MSTRRRGADLGREMPRGAPPSPFSRRRRARSFTTSRATCGMRAAGVPGRGENGKTWRCVSPHSSTMVEGAREHRLGLGREAGDDVGAEDDVGPQRAAPVAEARSRRRADAGASCASGSCRRRPAATDADAASAAPRSAMRVEQIVDRPRPNRSRRGAAARSSGTWRRMLFDQRAERRRAGQVGAVAGDVDAGQHHLAGAVLDERRAPARPPRPSAPSANCRGRTG